MNVAARAVSTPILRTVAGEPPLGANGAEFRSDQGTIWHPEPAGARSPMTTIGVLELEGGKWLAMPPGFHVAAQQYDSRDQALIAACDAMIERAHRYTEATEGISWTVPFASRVIEWALALKAQARAEEITPDASADKGLPAKTAAEEITSPVMFTDYERIDAGATISDPVVRELYEANRKRRHFPAKHVFSRTLAVEDGRTISLATCACGHKLKFVQGDEVRMNAAEEAHWRRFGHEAMLDGQGKAIVPGDGSRIPRLSKAEARALKKRAEERAEGVPADQLTPLPKSFRASSDGVRDEIADPAEPSAMARRCSEPEEDAPSQQQPGAEVAFRPSEAITEPGAGGPSAPIGPVTAAVPPTAGTGPSISDDGDHHRFWALLMIDAGNEIDGANVRDLVGIGYAHCTATRVMITDEGRAYMAAIKQIPEPAESNDPDQTAAGGVNIPSMDAEQAGEQDAGETTMASASDATSPAKLAPADPATEEGASGDARSHAPPAIYSEASPIGGPPRLPPSDDPVFMEWKALAAIEAGIGVSGPMVQDLIDRGLVVDDIVDGRLVITDDDGKDRLAELDARFNPVSDASPIGEASTEVGEPPVCPALGNAEADPVREAGLNGGSPARTVPAEISAAAVDNDDTIDLAWPSYDAYLEDKIVTAPLRGIEVERASLHPGLKEFCKDIVIWALRLGCAGIFAECGLHKTAMQLEWCRQLGRHTGGATLNVLPLGCRHGFIGEAEGRLDMAVAFVQSNEEFHALHAEGVRHFLTNYESIREGKLNPNLFVATSLDEASVLRSYGSKTFQEFMPLFAKVPFKLVATATPAPNRFKELIHYAGFLGVMDTGQALTRFFQRDSSKAGNLTLYPHMVDEFWTWVHSFAAFVQKPSNLGYSDEGYDLPPIELTWHEVAADHSKAEPDRDGQGILFRNAAQGLSEAASSRRDSLSARVAKACEIRAAMPDEHCLWWHGLEAEREALEAAVPGIVTITGSGMSLEAREARLVDFEEGRIKDFGTKEILSGLGSNFQYHCRMMIFVAMPGDGFKWELFYQALKRLHRFGQARKVIAHVIYSEDQREGRATLERKGAQDSEMRARMSGIIAKCGLNVLPMRDALARSIGIKRVEYPGERFVVANNDTVAEAKRYADSSIDLIVTSIPFLNKYEYVQSYNDFGHTKDSAHFWGQMDFLTAELLRILKPGRLACIHVKDEVEFGSVTGEGIPTIYPFHCEATMHYRAHGFQYCGKIDIETDVVTENAGTYRLGWSKNAEDSTVTGVGCPEMVLLFRKPQTDKSRGWADQRVTKEKPLCTDADGNQVPFDKKLPIVPGTGYSRARWQIDADAHWRSSGNRLLSMDELLSLGPETMSRLIPEKMRHVIYDHEYLVRIGEELERRGRLPTKFACLSPGSWHPDVWTDIDRMRTLNTDQAAKGREKHVCPLQFDTVDRLIDRFSNPDELVYDPFGGIGTVPCRALLKGRRGAMAELNGKYALDAVRYCHMAEEKMTTPQLFDLATFDAANTPPLDDLTETSANDAP